MIISQSFKVDIRAMLGDNLDFEKIFGNSEFARSYLEYVRWRGTFYCVYCRSYKTSKRYNKDKTSSCFQCWNCGLTFSCISKTILNGSKKPLWLYIKILWLEFVYFKNRKAASFIKNKDFKDLMPPETKEQFIKKFRRKLKLAQNMPEYAFLRAIATNINYRTLKMAEDKDGRILKNWGVVRSKKLDFSRGFKEIYPDFY